MFKNIKSFFGQAKTDTMIDNFLNKSKKNKEKSEEAKKRYESFIRLEQKNNDFIYEIIEKSKKNITDYLLPINENIKLIIPENSGIISLIDFNTNLSQITRYVRSSRFTVLSTSDIYDAALKLITLGVYPENLGFLVFLPNELAQFINRYNKELDFLNTEFKYHVATLKRLNIKIILNPLPSKILGLDNFDDSLMENELYNVTIISQKDYFNLLNNNEPIDYSKFNIINFIAARDEIY